MSVLTSFLLTLASFLVVSAPGFEWPEEGTMQASEWLRFDTLNLNVSGPIYDIAFYQDGIIFMKAGEGTLHLSQPDRADPENSRPLFENKQFSTSPASLSFQGDFTTGYYTWSLENEEQRMVEKIFEMSIENQEVSDLKQLLFTGDGSRYLHPAVSLNDSLMVFSSDRLPTSGGLDLFATRLTPEGWSAPTSLGEIINSSGHEWFPFLDKRNNLWFSSTGHTAYGGYDIFVCPHNGKDWDAPRNLGRSINGPQNELGFSLHPGKELALFSRVSPSGSGGTAFRLSLNEEAFESAGIVDTTARNISLILQSTANPPALVPARHQAEPEVTQEAETVQVTVQDALPDPDMIIFRVQIISSLNENSFPTVNIDGEDYNTFEYYYKGSYRITVGQFETLEEANAFRLQCKNSGFTQAFVAAFRGDKRETDPSVFKK